MRSLLWQPPSYSDGADLLLNCQDIRPSSKRFLSLVTAIPSWQSTSQKEA